MPSDFLRTIAALDAPQQNGTDYGVSPSLTIKEEIARYWRIANDLYDRFVERRPCQNIQKEQVEIEEWLVPFLRILLGYEDLSVTNNVVLDDRLFRLTHRACDGAIPCLLMTDDFCFDKADSRLGLGGRRQTLHNALQEYLNAEDKVLWGMVSNGLKLRILRDNPSLTRPAYLEADLDLIFTEELYPDFAALWLVAHVSRLRPADSQPSNCIIESWRVKAQETGERARENLRVGVTQTLRRLGNGFLCHPENTPLRDDLKGGYLSPDGYFQQLLRLVYRLLFLFTAEDRNLLHDPESNDEQRAVFQEGYALSRLRDRALRRRHYDRHGDLWEGLQITFQALNIGAFDLGLPALGGLFRVDQCPDLDGSAITNEYLLEAIHTLAFLRLNKGVARVNYRDMDTEELGSVYESLLEFHPVVDVEASPWRFSFIGEDDGEKSKGSKRKLTGSYYTPPTLVSELIKSTLDPVVTQAVASCPEDPCAAILALRIVDPACGSGHFLLAAARRLAVEIVRIEADANTSDEIITRQHALREVVQHCIYGVDRNPLAVELCKTALWMETVEPGKPLTFLDSHILQGNSLVGILDPEIMTDGIPDDAYKSLTGDDKAVCQQLKKYNRESGQLDICDLDAVLEVAMTSVDLDIMPEDTLNDVEHKRATWQTALLDETRTRETLRANLFVGAYFAIKIHENLEIIPHTRDIERLGSDKLQRRGVATLIGKLADGHDFLHWHLAFAEIMQDGGFDVVIGNPPWERIKLQEQEFFASRSTEIATARNKSVRDRLIQHLDRDDAPPAEKTLYQEFETAKREAEAVSQYIRTGGRFPLTGSGDLNTYAVFTETFLHLLNPRGRAGLIVPTGIATDNSTKAFFKYVVDEKRLVSLFDFENREAIFTGVHRSYKFCLLTLSGKDNPVPEAEFAFFLHQTEQLKEAERRFMLSADDFSLFNPNTRNCPIFRTQRDMEIARKLYERAGVFWKEANETEPEENPWGVTFQRMFDMSNDSGLFRTHTDLTDDGWVLHGNVFVRGEERYLPLYEAKLFHQYDHRFATFEGVSDKDIRNGNARPMTVKEKSDPKTVAVPRYWVSETEVEKRLDMGERGHKNPAEPSRAEPSRAEPSRAEPSRSIPSSNWHATHFQRHYQLNERANWSDSSDPSSRSWSHWDDFDHWIFIFRDIIRATDRRTAIVCLSQSSAAMNQGAPIMYFDYVAALQAFRDITNSTNERTFIVDNVPLGPIGNNAPVLAYSYARAVAYALVLGNMNSIPLDWSARLSVGGVHMSFFIVKQLPILPPETYLEDSGCGRPWVQLVVPRVLELTYTSADIVGFARDLGYQGGPFIWDKKRRHCLQCELDAIFANMYGLNRSDLEWILDSQSPSASFPSLKKREINEFGEYRTQRLVLDAFDCLGRGEIPDID